MRYVPLYVRRSWAHLIRQLYEVDPLLCTRCGGTMNVRAVIECPTVIRHILAHLGLPTAGPRFRALLDQIGGLTADQPRDWTYAPLYDDLPIPDPVIA